MKIQFIFLDVEEPGSLGKCHKEPALQGLSEEFKNCLRVARVADTFLNAVFHLSIFDIPFYFLEDFRR